MNKINDLIQAAKRVVYDAPQSDQPITNKDFTKDELVDMLNESIVAFEELFDILEKM